MEFLEVAISIGNKLIADAIYYDGYINWMSYSSNPFNVHSKKPVIVNLKYNYYDGLLGIALFFVHLYSETKDEKYKDACLSIIHTIEAMDIKEENGHAHSLYSGLGGKVYVYYYVGKLLEDENIIGLYTENLKIYLHQEFSKSKFIHDIISGPISLVGFIQKYCPEQYRDVANTFLEELGEAIMRCTVTKQSGKAWNTMSDHEPLLGYAHGTSGYIHALLELYDKSKNSKYLDTVLEAREYENMHFNYFLKNWPDLRKLENGTTGYMQAWCHGSPGILLARLMYDHLVDHTINEETLEVLSNLKKDNTDRMNDMSSFSLCHGLAGNCEPYFLAAKLSGSLDYLEEPKRVGMFGYNQYFKNALDFPTGMLYALNNPSLMVGDAGVGMFYLRLHNSEIPSPIFHTSV